MPPRVSVIVPVYNNADSLVELNRRLIATLTGTGAPFEIIYVDDGSRDSSLDCLIGLACAEAVVIAAELTQNFGQSAAVMAGFSLARGDILVTIDADLENHPEDVPSLVDAVSAGAGLACGVRAKREAPAITRHLPSLLANFLVSRALDLELRDWGCGLNALRSDIAERMVAQRPTPRLPKIEAALLADSVVEQPVAHSNRKHGRSAYTPRRLAEFALSFLLEFSSTTALRRIMRPDPARLSGHAGGEPHTGTASRLTAFACWALLSLLAGVARLLSLLARAGADDGRFSIRSVYGRRASAANALRPSSLPDDR